MYIKPSLVRENSARAHSIFWRRFSASRTRRTSSLSSSASTLSSHSFCATHAALAAVSRRAAPPAASVFVNLYSKASKLST